jgi:hypothetical protein
METFKPVPELSRVLEGAYPTADKILSSELATNQHICMHGDGTIWVWEFNDQITAFNRALYEYVQATPKQRLKLQLLSIRCRNIWKQELEERAARWAPPKRKLKFSPMLQKDRDTWYEAKVGKGSILLYPSDHGTGFCASFGPNSDRSFSGYMPACNMEDAQRLVHMCCADSLPPAYRPGGL